MQMKASRASGVSLRTSLTSISSLTLGLTLVTHPRRALIKSRKQTKQRNLRLKFNMSRRASQIKKRI
jgi:hypothetical protein